LLPIAAIAGSFIISLGIFLEIYPDGMVEQSLPWFAGMNLGILIDPLAVVMLMMVSFVSLLIHIYAVGYMSMILQDRDILQKHLSLPQRC